MTKDEMVGWHHRLDGHEFEQTPGDGEGQGGLACCSTWGREESDMTERLNNNFHLTQWYIEKLIIHIFKLMTFCFIISLDFRAGRNLEVL